MRLVGYKHFAICLGYVMKIFRLPIENLVEIFVGNLFMSMIICEVGYKIITIITTPLVPRGGVINQFSVIQVLHSGMGRKETHT